MYRAAVKCIKSDEISTAKNKKYLERPTAAGLAACLSTNMRYQAEDPSAGENESGSEEGSGNENSGSGSDDTAANGKSEWYYCHLTGRYYSASCPNQLVRMSPDCYDLVGVKKDRNRLLHHPENCWSMPLLLNRGKWTSSTATLVEVMKSCLTQLQHGDSLHRLKRLQEDGTELEADPADEVLEDWFNNRSQVIHDNLEMERAIPFLREHRLDPEILTSTTIEDSFGRLDQKTPVRIKPPAIQQLRQSYSLKVDSARPPARASTVVDPDPLDNAVVQQEADHRILGSLERQLGRSLPRNREGIRTPFTSADSVAISSTQLADIFAQRRQTLIHRCNRCVYITSAATFTLTHVAFALPFLHEKRQFETATTITARALYLSMCISVLEQDGVDKRTGLRFTNHHRSPDRLSIGRITPGTNMKTEFIVDNPQTMEDLQAGFKTIIAESWFTNCAQGNASRHVIDEAYEIVVGDFGRHNPDLIQLFDIEVINKGILGRMI